MTEQRDFEIWETYPGSGSWSWKVFDRNTGRVINQGSKSQSYAQANSQVEKHL